MLIEIAGWQWGNKKDLTWEENYALLEDFVKENNKLPVIKDTYKGIKLGTWCFTQRQNYNNDKLSDERIERLEEIASWQWGKKKEKKDPTWEENYALLLDFMEEHDESSVGLDTYNGVKLGIWCETQRQNYKKDKLSDERIERLNEIAGWRWGKKKEKKDPTWEENYALLIDFVGEHDRLPVATDAYKGIQLGSWCVTQRQNYKKDKLSDERKDKLETIPLWFWKK